jgi:hypothetical protein
VNHALHPRLVSPQKALMGLFVSSSLMFWFNPTFSSDNRGLLIASSLLYEQAPTALIEPLRGGLCSLNGVAG